MKIITTVSGLCLVSACLHVALAANNETITWRIVPLKSTFLKAEKVCQALGGALAAVESQSAMDEIIEYIKTTADLDDDDRDIEFWIGRNDIAVEGFFVNADGKLSNNFGWCTDDPDGEYEDDDCAVCARYSTTTRCFRDITCISERYFLCRLGD